MRATGGRGALGLGRARALLLVLLLAAPLASFAAPAQAQSSGDPWWGPSDKAHPTDGWAVRVPVVVENANDYILRSPLAAVDVDFGRLITKAGWTNSSIGTAVVPAGFTLDEDSIRVVEYARNGFAGGPIQGPATPPTPAAFYPGIWKTDRYSPYNNQTNPAGTLLVNLGTDLLPHEKRYFYVYANPLEFEAQRMAPAAFTPAQRAPLDALLSGGARGTVFYGFVPQQGGTQHPIVVRNPTSAITTATATLYVYENGRFVLAPPSGGFPNPAKIAPGSAIQIGNLAPNKAFKVVSDMPVVVAAWRSPDLSSGIQASEIQGFLPGLDGAFASRNFSLMPFRSADGASASAVTLVKSGSGSVTVSIDGSATETLTPGAPVKSVTLSAGWHELRGTEPFLVTLHPFAVASNEGMVTSFVPALNGAPVGTEFYAGVPADGGFYAFCADEPLHARIVSAAKPTLQAFPEGALDSTPPYDAKSGCAQLAQQPSTPTPPLDFYAAVDPRTSEDTSKVPFRVSVAATGRGNPAFERPAFGFVGGEGGLDFQTVGVPGKSGRVGVFGHYNGTTLTVTEDRLKNGQLVHVTTTVSIGEDRFVTLPLTGAFDPASLARFRIVASKPVSVTYVDPMQSDDGSVSYPYAQLLPARPQFPSFSVGAAEFRGPLVELRSPDAPGRHDLPKNGGPGTALDFRLDVLNLGRWIGGEGLPDTVTVSCNAPEGWRVTGCARDLSLAPNAAERLQIGITPSANDVNTTRTVTVQAVSKAGGSPSVFRFIIYVEVRYGVGMWFDVEGGRKTIDPPVGVDPGESHRYAVVVKNTGSTPDTYDLRVQDPKAGWSQKLTLDGVEVRTLALDAGESKTLAFDVTAPNAETAPKNFVSLSAQSQSSLLSGDVVNSATQIRPRISIRLVADPQTQVAAPGANATFNLTVNNSGNSIFLIRLAPDSELPEGWNSTFSVDPPEVNLNPGDQFTFGLNVTPPLGSRAGELATLKITALVGESDTNLQPGDQVSAVVVVRRIHNLVTPNLPDTEAEPGDALRYVLPLRNAGNGNEVLELLPGAVEPAWHLVADSPSLAIPYNESADLPLALDVPPGAPAGLTNVTFRVRLSREATQNLTLPIQVKSVAKLAFDALPELRTSPGKPTLVETTVTNVGNLEGAFAFAADAPAGWNVTFLPANATLGVGDAMPLRILVNASREAPDGAFGLDVRASYAGAAAGHAALAGSLAKPLLSLSGVQTTGSPRSDPLVLVSASVANKGDIAAENVTVALLVDGVAVDKVVLARIPVNDTKVATLNWAPTGNPKDVHVVIDPQGDIVQATREQTDAQVSFAKTLGIPALAPLALVGACGALALLLRRRSA